MIVDNSIVKKANDAFNQGDYSTAKKNYELAAERYGQHLFNINLVLCDRRIQDPEGEVFLIRSLENKKIKELELKIKQKDISINERFRELAILTQMLEGKQ